jgi:CPA1 family monovalent cation:H+ antiporter
MRGVLALAAAFSLPERLPDGTPFPQRNMIIYLTFCVIFATLVLQGLSMPWLIRRLGLKRASPAEEEEEVWARRQLIEGALGKLASLHDETQGQQLEAVQRLEEYYRRRLACLESAASDQTDFYGPLSQQLRDLERSLANNLRTRNKIHDELLRKLEHELDLMDSRLERSDS